MPEEYSLESFLDEVKKLDGRNGPSAIEEFKLRYNRMCFIRSAYPPIRDKIAEATVTPISGMTIKLLGLIGTLTLSAGALILMAWNQQRMEGATEGYGDPVCITGIALVGAGLICWGIFYEFRDGKSSHASSLDNMIGKLNRDLVKHKLNADCISPSYPSAVKTKTKYELLCDLLCDTRPYADSREFELKIISHFESMGWGTPSIESLNDLPDIKYSGPEPTPDPLTLVRRGNTEKLEQLLKDGFDVGTRTSSRNDRLCNIVSVNSYR